MTLAFNCRIKRNGPCGKSAFLFKKSSSIRFSEPKNPVAENS